MYNMCLKFLYKQPQTIILPSGTHYHYEYDSSGDLSKIKLPGETGIHEMSIQNGLFGVARFSHLLPGYNAPYVIHYKEDGRIVSIRPPQKQAPSVIYRYDAQSSNPVAIISGDTETHFTYDYDENGSTGFWLEEVNHQAENDFEMNIKQLQHYKEDMLDKGGHSSSIVNNCRSLVFQVFRQGWF